MTDMLNSAPAEGRSTAGSRYPTRPVGFSSVPADLDGNERVVREADIDFTRLFYMAFITLDTQIIIADTKAQLIMGANAVMIASLGFNQAETFGVLGNPAATTAQQSGLLLLLGMAVLMVMSVYYALNSSRPNLRNPQPGAMGRNLFFFGHVAQMSGDDYEQQFMGLTMEEVKRSVIRQIHAKSTIVTRKYAMINRSLMLLFLALILWLGSRVVLAIG